MVQYPTMVIGMITLGVVGYLTSAGVRVIGNYMMQWRARELAIGGATVSHRARAGMRRLDRARRTRAIVGRQPEARAKAKSASRM